MLQRFIFFFLILYLFYFLNTENHVVTSHHTLNSWLHLVHPSTTPPIPCCLFCVALHNAAGFLPHHIVSDPTPVRSIDINPPVIKSRLCSDYHCSSYTWIFFTCSTHDDFAFDCCLLVVLRCCLKCLFLELLQRNNLFSSHSDWSLISTLWWRCAPTATSKSSSFHPWNTSVLPKTVHLRKTSCAYV